MKILCQFRNFSLIFAWYDLWIGAYYDVGHRTLYIVPLPTLVFRFAFPGKIDEALHRTDRNGGAA